MAGVHQRNWRRKRRKSGRPLGILLLAFLGTSCVPVAMATQARIDAAVIQLADPEPFAAVAPSVAPASADAQPAAPLTSADAYVFRGRTALD